MLGWRRAMRAGSSVLSQREIPGGSVDSPIAAYFSYINASSIATNVFQLATRVDPPGSLHSRGRARVV